MHVCDPQGSCQIGRQYHVWSFTLLTDCETFRICNNPLATSRGCWTSWIKKTTVRPSYRQRELKIRRRGLYPAVGHRKWANKKHPLHCCKITLNQIEVESLFSEKLPRTFEILTKAWPTAKFFMITAKYNCVNYQKVGKSPTNIW